MSKDNQNIVALKESVDKYDIGSRGEVIGVSANDCPLCDLYLNKKGRCDGCPIKNYTNEGGCRDTPHEKLNNHCSAISCATHKDCPTCMKLCAEERDFLQGLLDKEYMKEVESKSKCVDLPVYVGSEVKNLVAGWTKVFKKFDNDGDCSFFSWLV